MWTKLLSVGLIFGTSVAGACVLSGATRVPANTPVALGPAVFNAMQADPAIGMAILAARDAWDVTNASNRIGDWSGVVTGADCPAGQPLQVGAIGFANSTCPTITGYFGNNSANILAFVDYYAMFCTQCGTRSVTLNLNFAWSLNPAPGQYDIQSVLAHEFGHVLGLAHEDAGVCNTSSSLSCASSPGRETMGAQTSSGETCMRDVSANDIASANSFYP